MFASAAVSFVTFCLDRRRSSEKEIDACLDRRIVSFRAESICTRLDPPVRHLANQPSDFQL